LESKSRHVYKSATLDYFAGKHTLFQGKFTVVSYSGTETSSERGSQFHSERSSPRLLFSIIYFSPSHSHFHHSRLSLKGILYSSLV